MWSRKPTPVVRVPAPVPSSVSDRRTSVSPVRALDRGGASHVRWILHDARLHRLGVHLEALGAGDRGAGGGEPRGARADAHLGHAPAEVARRERRGEARGAAGRQHVVGARDVVAEGGGARGARRTRSRPSARCGASASTSAPISCRCSGAKALASCERRARGCGLRRSRRPPRRRSGARRRALRARPRAARTAAVGRRRRRRGCPRRARPGRACRARPAERVRAGARRRARRAGRWARRSRRCPTSVESWCLASCTYRLPGPTITSTRLDASRCRRRARRSPARRPCGRRARRRTAGRCRGSPGRSRRRRPAGRRRRRRARRRRAR